jgi:hypothetical protein
MASSVYYRRQSDLCLRLALVQDDPEAILLLVEFAKTLRAKAEESPAAPQDGSQTIAGPRPGSWH